MPNLLARFPALHDNIGSTVGGALSGSPGDNFAFSWGLQVSCHCLAPVAHPENPKRGGGRQICDFPKPWGGGVCVTGDYGIFHLLHKGVYMSHCLPYFDPSPFSKQVPLSRQGFREPMGGPW